MSELRIVKLSEMNAIKLGLRNDKLYFKSEADKVIARHKYKRCLAMAKWCDERIARYSLQQEIQGISWQKEIDFYRRLKDKFIEISRRFKEAQ